MSFEDSVEKEGGIRVAHALRGKYGDVLEKGDTEAFRWNPPNKAEEFDGYIKTNYDTFAYAYQ